jgi:hypothetical protein
MATLSVGGTTVYNGTSLDNGIFPAGHMLQVKQGTFKQTQSLTGSGSDSPETWHNVGVSGEWLEVKITPAATTNKILLLANMVGGATNDCFFNITKGGTIIGVPTSASNRQPTLSGDMYFESDQNTHVRTFPISYLDSGGTGGNELTYQVVASIWGGTTFYINRGGNDTDAGWQPRGISTITAMEIQG